MPIPHASNLDQSYFMQEVPYYLSALEAYGREPEKMRQTQTSIRVLSREAVDGKQKYVFRGRLLQDRDDAFEFEVRVNGYEKVDYTAVLTGIGKEKGLTAAATPEVLQRRTVLPFRVPKDGSVEYDLTVMADKNFFVSAPITYSQPGLKEVYPIFREGITIGNGFRCFFSVPEGATAFTMVYKGRAWPLQFDVFSPGEEVAARDRWIGSNDLTSGDRKLRVNVGEGKREGWSFAVVGYGQARLTNFECSPPVEGRPFYFATSREKLFEPGR